MIRLISIVGILFNCVLLSLLSGLFLVRCYIYVGILHFVFIGAFFIKNKYISTPACLSSLMISLFVYWSIYRQKSYAYTYPDSVTSILNMSVPIDIIVVSIIFVLFFLQCLDAVRKIRKGSLTASEDSTGNRSM